MRTYSEASKNKIRESVKKYWDTVSAEKKADRVSKATKWLHSQTDEEKQATRAKNRLATNKQWSDPNSRQKLLIAMQNKPAMTSCTKSKISKASKQMWENKAYREKMAKLVSVGQLLVWKRPGYKAMQVAKFRGPWKNPEYRDKHIPRLLNQLSKTSARPNVFESHCMKYLEKLFPGKFVYTGNGDMLVNGRSADAYSEELNTVVLFHGVYWHLKRYGLDITEENKRSVEKIDSIPFLSAGYRVMFIWEDEVTRLVEYAW